MWTYSRHAWRPDQAHLAQPSDLRRKEGLDVSTEHERLASRISHPSGGRSLWAAIELSAPVEAIWMLELAALVSEREEVPRRD